MSTTVKIQDKNSGTVLEFPTLDNALRTLNGVIDNGDRFQKVLLDVPSRRTFKEAHGLLERNGYTLYRAELRTQTIPTSSAEVTIKLEESIKHEQEKQTEEVKTEPQAEDASELMKAIELLRANDHKLMDKFNGLLKELDSEFDKINLKLNEEKVKEIVIKKYETGETTKVGKQHYQFETLLQTIAARVNVLLVGPAGSGKTSAANASAKALNIPFYSISVGMQTTKTEFFGYMDATGKYIKTLFRQAFEHGGVFLLDEMDAGNANVITAINQALANGYCAFPDGMITKHPDFVVVASANTFGTGANREYVGRNQLDAATLDRFAVIEWNYDEALEAELCSNKLWLTYVRTCRKNADKHKIRTVISPRASIMGAQLINQGIKKEAVKNMLIFKGMNETERVKLIEGASF